MSFIKELKRRNVFRVAIAYAIVSWLILQLTDVLMPLLSLPEWVGRFVFLLLVIGFLLALVLSWAYELTPEGVKLEKDVDRSASVTPVSGRKLDFFIIAALALALVFVVIDQYVLEESAPVAAVSENLRFIAVLPFDNRSAEEENAAFLADGVHDELLTRLSKIHDLRVISRTSVMEYRDTTKNMRQIGAELGVGSILEGGVQRAGDTVRINIQLIDVQTDEHLWAEIYDKELTATNLFAIQTEISTSIAEALQATLSLDEQQRVAAVPTENIEALEAFFTGNQLIARRDAELYESAIEYYERAIELDPEFARAYAGLAAAWIQLQAGSPAIDLTQARAEATTALQKAIELDPDSPDALATSGWHDLRYDYDWQGAERSFRHALQIEPTNTSALHWYSHLLTYQGRHEESITLAEEMVTLDPLSLLFKQHLSSMYAYAGRTDEANSLGEEVLRRDPSRPLMMSMLWAANLRAHRAEEAAAMLKVWAETAGLPLEAAQELGNAFVHYQQTGETVVLTDELLERLRLQDSPEVYAAVGDGDRTIAALQERHTRRRGSSTLLSMKIIPTYDFIRDDPRFIELLEQIGLAD